MMLSAGVDAYMVIGVVISIVIFLGVNGPLVRDLKNIKKNVLTFKLLNGNVSWTELEYHTDFITFPLCLRGKT